MLLRVIPFIDNRKVKKKGVLSMRQRALQTGDIAPDFTLPLAEGQTIRLSDSLQRGRSILLVFLRHLG